MPFGGAPRSTNWPGRRRSWFSIVAGWLICWIHCSTVVSTWLAARRCSGAPRMRMPLWDIQTTAGARLPEVLGSVQRTRAGPHQRPRRAA
eukprot:6532833-Alexandrium_andersonii.AAC.1